MRTTYIEIEEIESLNAVMKASRTLKHYAFQSINFNQCEMPAEEFTFSDCLFMGCTVPVRMYFAMDDKCIVFPKVKMPYKVFPNALYDAKSLYLHYDPDDVKSFNTCYDTIVYERFLAYGRECTDIKETLCRTLHDHSISNALNSFLDTCNEKDVVAVMGGHSTSRAEDTYRQIAVVSKKLTELGKLMVSGGGPGSMEAVHLGAWMAGYSLEELDDAISMLAEAPVFSHPCWLSAAFKVMEKYPSAGYSESLGIPTWLYGHEPSTPFATKIAKFFDNSIRENFIISVAKGGIIYTPGSAGTFQEIFQDAAQNHYETLGYASPMVFMGKKYYTEETPFYNLLADLQHRGKYKNLILSLCDSMDEVVSALLKFHLPGRD